MDNADRIWEKLNEADALAWASHQQNIYVLPAFQWKKALPIIEAELTPKWRKENPDKPGGWWFRAIDKQTEKEDHRQVFDVIQDLGKLVIEHCEMFTTLDSFLNTYSDELRFEWAGPIPEPPKGE